MEKKTKKQNEGGGLADWLLGGAWEKGKEEARGRGRGGTGTGLYSIASCPGLAY